MSSLRPKEGGGYTAPPNPPTAKPSFWIPVVLAVVIVAIAAIGYGQYTTKTALEAKIATLEEQVAELETNQGQDVKKLQASAASLASDVNSVSRKLEQLPKN
jgi:flagellar basal body-associated protein FliL